MSSNEYYAREASKKTKSAKKAKAKAGQFIGSKPPFGYKLDPNDRHHLIVDEPAAEVVRRIFTLASQGNGFTRIAKILREEKVLTPIAYFNIHNPDYFKSDYWRQEFDWHCESVRVMLNNEVYLGKLVYGKQRNKSMKSKNKVKNPPEEWIVAENCHEPIVTQEMWDNVHKLLSSKHREIKTGEVQMFAGLVKCADCGHALTYSQKQRADGSYHGSYSCWMYKTHGKEYCASHYITYDDLYAVVFADIQRVIRAYEYDADRFRRLLDSRCSSNADTTAKNVVKIIRLSYASLVQAAKVLFLNPDRYSFGDQMCAAAKIIATGASVVVGTLVTEAISKTPIGAIPVVGGIASTFCGTLVTGIMSCTLLYFFDNNKTIRAIVEFLNKIPSIDKTLGELRAVGEELDAYAAKLMDIDIEGFKREVAEWNKVSVMIENSSSEYVLNQNLRNAMKMMNIEIPWESTHDSFDSFMKDKNAVLKFG